MGCIFTKKSKSQKKKLTVKPKLTIEIPPNNYGPVISTYCPSEIGGLSICYRYEDSIVKKVYLETPLATKQFLNEINVCSKLNSLEFIPNIFDIDENNKSFFFIQTNCITKLPDNKTIKKYLNQLKNYGITYNGDVNDLSFIYDNCKFYLCNLGQIPIHSPLQSDWTYIVNN